MAKYQYKYQFEASVLKKRGAKPRISFLLRVMVPELGLFRNDAVEGIAYPDLEVLSEICTKVKNLVDSYAIMGGTLDIYPFKHSKAYWLPSYINLITSPYREFKGTNQQAIKIACKIQDAVYSLPGIDWVEEKFRTPVVARS